MSDSLLVLTVSVTTRMYKVFIWLILVQKSCKYYYKVHCLSAWKSASIIYNKFNLIMPFDNEAKLSIMHFHKKIKLSITRKYESKLTEMKANIQG